MPKSIAIGLKRAAIILAEKLDYARAAEKMNITSAELRKRISALEALLCRIFKPRQKKVELTEEGQFLIKVFREAAQAASSKTAHRTAYEQANTRPAKAARALRAAPPMPATKREGACP